MWFKVNSDIPGERSLLEGIKEEGMEETSAEEEDWSSPFHTSGTPFMHV